MSCLKEKRKVQHDMKLWCGQQKMPASLDPHWCVFTSFLWELHTVQYVSCVVIVPKLWKSSSDQFWSCWMTYELIWNLSHKETTKYLWQCVLSWNRCYGVGSLYKVSGWGHMQLFAVVGFLRSRRCNTTWPPHTLSMSTGIIHIHIHTFLSLACLPCLSPLTLSNFTEETVKMYTSDRN